MIKYFVFENSIQYRKIINLDYRSNPSVFYFDGFENSALKFLYRTFFNDKLRYIQSPHIVDLWYRLIMPEKTLIDNQRVFFIFYEVSPLAYTIPFLKRLKQDFPNSKFIFRFSNPPLEYSLNKLSLVECYYDMIVTLSEEFRRGRWVVFSGEYSKISIPKSNLPTSDLFFVGLAKDRFDLLINVYRKVSSFGLKCDFFISGVSRKRKMNCEGIVFNKFLDYSEVLKRIASTKCILEITPGGHSYNTLRMYEAISFKKKLLSTNKKLTYSKYYNSNNMFYFSTPDDISEDFFKSKFCDTDYDLYGFSPLRFLDFISEFWPNNDFDDSIEPLRDGI